MSPHNFYDLSGITAILVMLGSFLGVARKVTKKLDRDESLKRDFPPHRHIGNEIVFPDEYQPSKVHALGRD